MDYKVLYRKYRPNDFDNLYGQEHIVRTLKNAIKSEKKAHAYIFSGPRGTGKTSTAKIFAKAINCEHPVDGNPCGECLSCLSFNESADIIEIDAASNNGVEEIREIINHAKLTPSSSKYKVYIIDEVHMLTTSAFNALLLTLEEPPRHVIFILATTDVQNVPITVLSRCQRYDFKPISVENIVKRLKVVCEKEKIEATEDGLTEIALLSEGALRDALSILDQVNDNSKIDINVISKSFGTVSTKEIDKLIKNIEENETEKVVDSLDEYSKSGINHKVFALKLIERLKKNAIELKLSGEFKRLNYKDLKNFIFDLNSCITNIKTSVNPYILIELVILDYISSNQAGNERLFATPEEEIIKENIEETVVPIQDENTEKFLREKAVNPTEVHEDDLNYFEKLINIRINNCFVGAKKEFLTTLKDNWPDLLKYIKANNLKLLSYLEDSEPIAASIDYAILQTTSESISEMFNDVIIEFEKDYKKFANDKYKFIAISKDRWKEEKQKYIENTKNKVVYELKDEKEVLNKAKKKSKIEIEGQEIFGDLLKVK